MSTLGLEAFTDFERHLSQWLARSEQLVLEPASPRQTEPVVLGIFEDRLHRLQVYLDKAEGDVEQALAPLTAEIEALQRWLEALNEARGKLAECTLSSEPD